VKVWILGPISTPSYYGGVAIFDEEIAQGLADNSCEVEMITLQNDAADRIHDRLPVHIIRSKSAFCKRLTEEKPDVILASLDYAKLLPKRADCKKVYFLHGFFNQSYYGALKSQLAAFYQKQLIKKCDMVFANSDFTRMANREFFGIDTDGVFRLGVSQEFYQNITSEAPAQKQTGSIFYCGRLVSAKGVRNLMKAAKILKDRGCSYSLKIAGTGDQQAWMEAYAEAEKLPVEFLGRLSQKEVCEHYKNSEIFISLNPSEPFGISFIEALLCGCKIVCPVTGGQVETLCRWPQSTAFAAENDPEEIANGIEKMLSQGIAPVLSPEEQNAFTYQHIAGRMLKHWSAGK